MGLVIQMSCYYMLDSYCLLLLVIFLNCIIETFEME